MRADEPRAIANRALYGLASLSKANDAGGMMTRAGAGPEVRPSPAIIGRMRALMIFGLMRTGECALSRMFR